MKIRTVVCVSLILVGHSPAFMQSEVLSSLSEAACKAEEQLGEQLRNVAYRYDLVAVDRLLSSEEGIADQIAPSVLLAQRAVGLCAWLRNIEEHAMAMRIAERAVAYLETMDEGHASDRVERLYWESALLGDFLGQKEVALSLLQQAERLAPDDARLMDSALELAQALAEFGK